MAPEFPLLPLPLVVSGRPRLFGGGRPSEQIQRNKDNREGHSRDLSHLTGNIIGNYRDRMARRSREGLPPIPPDVPILLKVDPDFDLEKLRTAFDLEVISEQEDGFVVVSSESVDLETLVKKIEGFSIEAHGTGAVASLYEIFDDQDQSLRLERILSEQLRSGWGALRDDEEYIVDLGVECLGKAFINEFNPRKDDESDERYGARLDRWNKKKIDAYMAWDDVKSSREDAIQSLVEGYGGEVLNIIDGEEQGLAELPDSFTVRVKISGIGLRDVALNFPFVFEICEPEIIEDLFWAENLDAEAFALDVLPPDEGSPAVCVIDSGIQEEHQLLQSAIDGSTSICLVPGESITDTADYVSPGGHGTRVAGAVLYPGEVPTSGSYQLPFIIQNARVLDSNCRLVPELFPPLYVRKVVESFPETKIFNHSIGGFYPCRLRHMSAWASEIDRISHENDVLFIQSAGNIPGIFEGPIRIGVQDNLLSGEPYPGYLLNDSSRIPNPAQSFQALTVGSIAQEKFVGSDSESFGDSGQPSAFSASGLGVWGSVKPEVVEYGGDFVRAIHGHPDLTTPPEVCPDLVRGSMAGPGPASSRDAVGTSFAAPKVASIAAALNGLFPSASPLLYRAIIVNSARWPQAFESDLNPANKGGYLRCVGYGLPDMERATSNSPYRVTLVTDEMCSVGGREAHIYQVPIPDTIRQISNEFDIRIDVTMSYSAMPRRTRRNPRNYLSTWLDWTSSKVSESYESFKHRVLSNYDSTDTDGESELPWHLRNRVDYGVIPGIKRSVGTVQKDWAIIKANRMPEDFSIAVRGHVGWDKTFEQRAKYALVISFDVLGREMEVFNDIRIALQEVEVQPMEVEIGVGV